MTSFRFRANLLDLPLARLLYSNLSNSLKRVTLYLGLKMKLPEKVQRFCEQYLEKVREDPEHQLNPYYRINIYKQFQDETNPVKEQFIRWLQIITAQRVTPAAKHFLPDEFNPEDVIQIAIGLLSKTTPLETAKNS
jgi:hypothetical protein